MSNNGSSGGRDPSAGVATTSSAAASPRTTRLLALAGAGLNGVVDWQQLASVVDAGPLLRPPNSRETRAWPHSAPSLSSTPSLRLCSPALFSDDVATSRLSRLLSKLWHGVLLGLRAAELCVRFVPLVVLYPVCVYVLPTWAEDLWYRLLTWSLRHSGPCFIKLGQWLSTRRDLLPEHLCRRLAGLRSQAPAHAMRHTRRMFRKAFGRDIGQIFSQFPTTPIASGAVAQVYRATLKAPIDGVSEVAVKVRHPHVREHITRDLALLQGLVCVIEWVWDAPWLQLSANVQNFAARMSAQCNLAVEAGNLVHFKQNFRDAQSIRFPTPVEGFYHPLVLVESFEPGIHVERFTREDIAPDVRKTIASVGMDAFLKMMLVDNFVHADLHPGNILVDDGRDAGSSPQVVLLDVGLITQLSEKDRENFLKLFSAVVAGDAALVGHLITDGQDHLTPQVVQQFTEEVGRLMAKVKLTRLDEVPLSEIFFEMLSIARRNKVILEANFTTLIIGTVVIEGLGRQLDPDLNLLQRAVPLLVKDRAIRDAYIKARLSARLPSLFRPASV